MAAQPPKPSRPSRTFSVESATRQFQPRPASEAEAIASLQAALERARGEYSLRRFDAVERILNEAEANLQPVIKAAPSGELYAECCFLNASLLCLRGRLLISQNRPEEARAAFTESVRLFQGQDTEVQRRRRTTYSRLTSLFESQNVELERQKSATRIFTDYGIALSRTEHPEEAMELLKQVCESGAAPSEAFGYLGYIYQQRRNVSEAESAFRKGLLLAPGDPKLLRYLAETLDSAKKRNEAVAAYCEAAQAAWRINDLQAASDLAKHALALAPTHTQALNLAVNIEFARQNLASSMDFVEAFLKYDPQNALALGLKGQLLRIAGDLNQAITTLRAVEVSTPELAWVLVELAATLHQLGSVNDQEALDVLDRAYNLNPQDTQALYVRSQILLDANKPAESVEALRRAIEINPQSALLRSELGWALLSTKNYDDALAAFETALSLDRESLSALDGKAELLRLQGKLDEALYVVRRALRLSPNSEPLFHRMIDLLLEQGSAGDAIEELDSEIQRNPQAAGAHWRKGQILRDQEDLVGAREAFEKAMTIDQDNPTLVLEFANILGRLDQYEKAGKAYDDLLELQPDSPLAIGAKAEYLSEIASFSEASHLLEKAVDKAPDQAWLWNLQGWCLQHLGKEFMARAHDAYKKALSVKTKDEDDLWYRKGLANTLCQLGLEAEAKIHFEKIIEDKKYTQGNDAEILSALGWCHYRLRRYDEGLRLFHATLSVRESLATEFDLALTLLASSRSKIALAEYRRACDLTSRKHVLGQRCLYFVALYDLVDAAKDGRIGSDGEPIFELLRSHLADSGVDLTTLRWLGDQLPTK
jgi:tetratricopeptide (TPR) repeat protein